MPDLSFLWWLPFGRVPEISATELSNWLNQGKNVQLIDTRTLAEYQQGSLPGAVHAPLTGMPRSVAQLDFEPKAPVIALCLSGHRSMPAVRWLRAKGYQAFSLQGGILNWKSTGYPLMRPPKTR